MHLVTSGDARGDAAMRGALQLRQDQPVSTECPDCHSSTAKVQSIAYPIQAEESLWALWQRQNDLMRDGVDSLRQRVKPSSAPSPVSDSLNLFMVLRKAQRGLWSGSHPTIYLWQFRSGRLRAPMWGRY